MRTSDIILSQKEESNVVPKRVEKFIDAYRKEKTHQEITEVELNRTKIVMIDENGNIKRVPILSEHWFIIRKRIIRKYVKWTST